jgi:prolyl-tRNA editing enzyme YbaK/EbsC (Cys-tRNA(Pro) deacylase)
LETTLTERLLELLRANSVDHTVLRHQPVQTSAEAARVRGTPLEQGAKALVYRADSKLVLLVVPADRRVDGKAFKRAHSVRDLRMVSAEDLMALTGLEVGAVPPFGSLMGLATYADSGLLALPRISFNAGSRSVSIVMAPGDYLRLERPEQGEFAAAVGPST